MFFLPRSPARYSEACLPLLCRRNLSRSDPPFPSLPFPSIPFYLQSPNPTRTYVLFSHGRGICRVTERDHNTTRRGGSHHSIHSSSRPSQSGSGREGRPRSIPFPFLPPLSLFLFFFRLSVCLSVCRASGRSKVETFFWRPPRIDWSRCFPPSFLPSFLRLFLRTCRDPRRTDGRTMTAAADLSIIHRWCPYSYSAPAPVIEPRW